MAEGILLGRYEAIKNGKPLKYKIQTITSDLYDEVLDKLMVPHFLSREPLTSHDRYLEDPIALKLIKDLWLGIMKGGAALVALEETIDGSINIIGGNMTVVAHKDEKETKITESNNYNKLLDSLNDIEKRGNIFEKYKIDKYLAAYGLTVHPSYHGFLIGYRLLECRKPLCEALGVPASATVFTAQVSQHIAAKVGFEVLSVTDYKTYKFNGQIGYPHLTGDMKYMAIKYK